MISNYEINLIAIAIKKEKKKFKYTFRKENLFFTLSHDNCFTMHKQIQHLTHLKFTTQ